MPAFKPQIPIVVDPTGVHASTDPRPMGMGTAASRAEVVEGTGGSPLVDFVATSNP